MNDTQLSDILSPKRRGSNPRYAQPWARYTPFVPLPEGELDGPAAVRHHLEWLLANMDWFASQGRGLMAGASVALHRDLAHIGCVAPNAKTAAQLAELLKQPSAAEIAALVQPPSAQQVAVEVAKLQQQHGAARSNLHNALDDLHQWFHQTKDVYYDPEARRCYNTVRDAMHRALANLGESRGLAVAPDAG
ncbi:MAG: hypothetical protein M3R04_04880 [bacterium]|nr:hypothetical protein [bacterium]